MKKIIAIILILLPLNAFAFSVGVVSDIHAGSKKVRKSGSSVIYPRKAVSFFEKAVKEMKAKGVSLIVSLGDNTNTGEKKYYKQLKAMEKKYGIKVLWVKGNHDDSKKENILAEKTYFYDKDGIRFIVLDTTLCPKSQKNAGCLDQSQSDFLAANRTEKTVILQHVPPVIPYTCDWRSSFEAEKETTIFAGHFHEEAACGDLHVFPPLTEHKILNYRIIEL